MRQRPQALAAAFAAAGHDVYFVDPREQRSRIADGVRIVPQISETPRSGVILLVHYPPLRELFDRYDDAAVVYDILDDLTIFDPDEEHLDPSRRVSAHHPIVTENATVVTASSAVLHAKHLSERSDLLLVENGVDLSRFAVKAAPPSGLPPRPIAGYHGAIADWFDYDLMVEVATAMPEWNFVLVGPVLPPSEERASSLAGLDNVTLVGEQSPADIPAYVQAFDVGMVPFRVTEMTEGVSPLKMFEYLAAGVPVVSTPLPSAVDSPSTVVASDGAGFAAAIAAADHNDAAWRQRAAAESAMASWDERLRPVLARLEELGLRRA